MLFLLAFGMNSIGSTEFAAYLGLRADRRQRRAASVTPCRFTSLCHARARGDLRARRALRRRHPFRDALLCPAASSGHALNA